MGGQKFTNRDLPTDEFTIIRNEAVYDPRLSLKALGLLVIMRSRPAEWVFYLSELQTHIRDGRDALRSALNELIELGYVKAQQTRRQGGKFGHTDYDVTDRRPVDGSTVAGKPAYGKTVSGKPASNKTDSIKTDSIKTEKHSSISELSVPEPQAGLVPQAARANRSITKDEAESFLSAWNDNRGQLPACQVLTDKRRKGIARFLKDLPGDADGLAVFRAAVQEVARDSFWIERKYGLDNLLVQGRVVEKAEKHMAGPRADRKVVEAVQRASSFADRIRARRANQS